MPLYEFRCCNKHVSEILLPMDHNKWQRCETCEMMAYQIPSAFRMPCAKRENFFGVDIPIADGQDPWEGTPLEGGGAPSLKKQLVGYEGRPTVDLGSQSRSRRSAGLSDADRIVAS